MLSFSTDPFLQPIDEETTSELQSAVSGRSASVRSGHSGLSSALRPPSASSPQVTGNEIPDGIRNNGLKRWWHVMGGSAHSYSHSPALQPEDQQDENSPQVDAASTCTSNSSTLGAPTRSVVSVKSSKMAVEMGKRCDQELPRLRKDLSALIHLEQQHATTMASASVPAPAVAYASSLDGEPSDCSMGSMSLPGSPSGLARSPSIDSTGDVGVDLVGVTEARVAAQKGQRRVVSFADSVEFEAEAKADARIDGGNASTEKWQMEGKYDMHRHRHLHRQHQGNLGLLQVQHLEKSLDDNPEGKGQPLRMARPNIILRLFVLLSLLAIAIGLGIRFSGESARVDTNIYSDPGGGSVPTAPATPNQSIDPYREDLLVAVDTLLLRISSLTAGGDSEDTIVSMPRRRAKEWITSRDEMELWLDVDQPPSLSRTVVSEQRYIQRYVLALIYYSMDGPDGLLAGEGGNWRDLVDILDRKDSGQEIRGNGGGKSQLRARDRLGVVSVDGRERQPLPHQGKPQNGERTLYDSKMVGRKRDQRRVVDNVIDRSSKLTAGPTAFLSSAHECQWLGVSCESRRVVDASTGKLSEAMDDFVVAIDLSAMGLSGSIPHELGYLHALQDLSLYSNFIIGPIPESLGSLEELFFLDLADNLLTGTIPLFGEALTFLYLNQNQLTGRIPEGESDVDYQLRHMWLHQNDLTGGLGEGLASFANLEQLLLYENMLSSTIPAAVSALSELTYLDISLNSFSGTLPDTFDRLTLLTNLYLSNNQFSGTIPKSISALPLQFLWVDSNELSGNIHGGLGDLIELQSLLLQDNAFTGTMPGKVCVLVNGSSFGKLERLEADCGGGAPELECGCCTVCWDQQSDGL